VVGLGCPPEEGPLRRRDFIVCLGLAFPWPDRARAQQADRTRRIGLLLPYAENDPEAKSHLSAITQELKRLGWSQDRNIRIEARFAAMPDQFPALAKELVALQPDALLSESTPAAAALKQETRSIPIVFVGVSDPIGSGFVTSLARPEGNLTGMMQYESGIVGKWLEMLKEVAPRLARVAFVANPKFRGYDYFLRFAQAAAPTLAIELVPKQISDDAADIERAIESFARTPEDGLLMVPDGTIIAHRDLVISLAARFRLPAVYPWRYFVTAGALMSYGIDNIDMLQKAASYVNRILRGAKPVDLPVQAPTKFETAVNLKTAKALGLTIPPALLATADEVIE
jgi:putative tryptophan/tyrosine transport system substrate-binding protein